MPWFALRHARSVHGLRAVERGMPRFAAIEAKHRAYVAALEGAGIEVERLEPLEADSIFVEDPALVFPQRAILLRPGAATRSGEVTELAPALRLRFERVLELPAPGFVEGAMSW
jgi:dimethylargininase